MRIKHQTVRPFGLLWSLFLSIPFYFLWNALAPIYAPTLPPLYQHLPFWNCVGLFGLAAVIRSGILGL
jgi:hypothetical protein